jgi:hypothetical protein
VLKASRGGEDPDNDKHREGLVKAGQQAMARSATLEAVTQLRKGLDLLALLPDRVERHQCVLDLKVTLAAALVATRAMPRRKWRSLISVSPLLFQLRSLFSNAHLRT